LPTGQLREGPHFIPRVCVSVPPSVPRWTERVQLAVASPLVQAFTISVLVRHPRLRARRFSRGSCFEAAKFASCYGPLTGSPFTDKDFYARAFTPRSRLPRMSSMTTRAHSQFPRPDLHRQHTQRCGLQTEARDRRYIPRGKPGVSAILRFVFRGLSSAQDPPRIA
jgi:hypothetical protein